MGRERTDAVEDMLSRLRALGRETERASVGDVLAAIGERGFGPFLFVPALLEITPIGGIPGLPTLLATIIAIFAAQIALGRDHLWLPQIIEQRRVSGDRLSAATEKLQRIGAWMDRRFARRMESWTGGAAERVAAICCIALCLTVPPLEIIPFASSVPMAAIAAFGLAMTARDGLLMIAGFVLSVAAAGVGAYLLAT